MQALHLFRGVRNRLPGRDKVWRMLQRQRRRVTQPEDSTPTKTKRWHLLDQPGPASHRIHPVWESPGPARRQIHPTWETLGTASHQIHSTWETPRPASHRIHPIWKAPGLARVGSGKQKAKWWPPSPGSAGCWIHPTWELKSANKTRPSSQVFLWVQRKGAVERINEHQRAIAENDRWFWRWWQAQEGGTVLTLKKHRTTFGMWVVSSSKFLCFTVHSSCRGPRYFKVLKMPQYNLEMMYSDSGFQPHRLMIFLWNKVSTWRSDGLSLALPVPMKPMANFTLRSISITAKTST